MSPRLGKACRSRDCIQPAVCLPFRQRGKFARCTVTAASRNAGVRALRFSARGVPAFRYGGAVGVGEPEIEPTTVAVQTRCGDRPDLRRVRSAVRLPHVLPNALDENMWGTNAEIENQ